MKILVKLAIGAVCVVLFGTHTFGQAAAYSTNAALVIQANTNAAPTVTISPEVRLEMIEAAGAEIGAPAPNDMEDLLARHGAMKQKILAVQNRHAPTPTDGASTLRAPAGPAIPASVPQQVPTVQQLDHVISQLSAIRSQLIERIPIQAGK